VLYLLKNAGPERRIAVTVSTLDTFQSSTIDLANRRSVAAQASGGISGNAIYNAVLRAVNDFQLRGDLLDFGSGTGFLAEQLKATELFTTVAADDLLPRPASLDESIAWTAADLNESLPYDSASFDVIVAAEVIEHLENPRFVAREMFRLLRPGGALILTTPNNESWRSLISLLARGHHVAFGDGSYPAHITPLLRIDLQRILTEAGFHPPLFRYTGEGGLPGYPTITWQKISAGLLKGLRFSDNLLAVSLKRCATDSSHRNNADTRAGNSRLLAYRFLAS
jgi:2-polyprenyl-3-methyl-5-hydroxy-6-metoxy-1,4-benzoquinol methylase